MTSTLAFDVGATHLRSAWVDAQGAVTGRRDVDTPRGDADALALALVREARAQVEERGERPDAVGLAIAGYTDTRRGFIHCSPHMGVRGVSVGPPLHEALGVPVRLVNDVNAAAWSEASVRGCRELVAIFVGTGIGTGFVVDGHLLEGRHGMAGEGGHIIFRPGGLLGSDGDVGSYSAYLGGDALAGRARAAGLDTDGAGLVAAARDGRADARAILDDSCAAMAQLVNTLVKLFDPELLVVGGGVVEGTPELLEAARAAADPHPLGADVLAVPVEPARLGADAGLVGAAWLAHARAVRDA